MAATFDTTAGLIVRQGNGDLTSDSTSITPSVAGSTIFLVIAREVSFGNDVSGTPTCGGSAMTEVGTAQADGLNGSLHAYQAANQPASARTVAWGFTGGGATNSPWIAFIFVVNGADTTTPIAQNIAGAGPNSQAATGTAGNLLIGINFASGGGASNPSGGTCSPGTMRGDTYRNANPTTGDWIWQALQTVAASGSSQTLSFTPATSTFDARIRVIEVAAAAGGGGTTVNAAGTLRAGTPRLRGATLTDATPHDPFVTVLFRAA